MNSFWYILRVLPGKERQITDEFNEKISHGKINNIIRFVCPIEKEFITVRKKKVLRDKVIYNGYIYFETSDKLSEDDLKYISIHENIMSMSGSKIPQLLRQSDIDRIIKDDELSNHVKTQLDDYVIGEKVEIINGPFLSFGGEIKEIIGEKVTLDVTVFGRPTNVILDKEQIKKYI